MYSDGWSSSESDISSSSGSLCGEPAPIYRERMRRRRIRQDSVTSVSTNPEEDAYVMVLQNRHSHFDNIKNMTSLRDHFDVKFLAGEERKPVDGVRNLICSRNRLLRQFISSFEKNRKVVIREKESKLRKTIGKLTKLSCVKKRRHQTEISDDKEDKLAIPMKAFDPESFQRFINYFHCGTLTIDSSTVVGVLNAAFMFDVPEVKQACWDFALGCVVRTDNLYDLFSSVRKYADHKMTKELLKTMEKYFKEHPHILVHSASLSELANTTFEQLGSDYPPGSM